MRSKRIPTEEQYRLIMECRQSGLTDHQWCVNMTLNRELFTTGQEAWSQKGCGICQRQPDAAIVHRKARKLSEWIFMILTRSHMNSH